MTKFVKEEGVSLQNHMIRTVNAAAPVKCRWDCVDIPLCFSINVRKLPSGRVTCELNNSSKTADPQDLVPSAESQYQQMAVSGSLSVSVAILHTPMKISYDNRADDQHNITRLLPNFLNSHH